MIEFSKEEIKTLAKALYCAGAFVAQAEDVDGDADDEKETAALRRSIAILSKDEENEIVAKIASKVIEEKDNLSSWDAKAFNAPKYANKSLSILRARGFDKTELKTFRAAILFVARVVGEASGEYETLDAQNETGGFFGKFLSKFKKSSFGAANISAGEAAAIEQLKEAMQ